jgi:2-(3-amino-3-carboxypropyl)histidine synthase
VFVEIDIDIDHLAQSITYNFGETPDEPLYILGTIQFNKALYVIKSLLEKNSVSFPSGRIRIPQTKPRSGGEVLGCTSPVIGERGSVVFISDGRFHIESAMIKNPQLKFYQYNPYSMKITEEAYEHAQMHEIRYSEIKRAREAQMWGIVFGTLGRQGNQGLLKEIEGLLRQHGKPYFILFLSELSPAKLNRFP